MDRLHLLGFTNDLEGVVFGGRRNAKKATHWVPIDETFLAALTKLERARRERERAEREAGKRSPRAQHLTDIELPTNERRKTMLPPVGRSQARSGLPAAEIQQMLRSGRSPKTVAAAAKAPLAWVERLAEPVQTERVGVVRLAQRAYMVRPRLGQAGLQLGDAVRRNLEERRATTDTIDALDDAWDAKAYASGNWRIWVRFSHRGKRRSAEWEFRKGSRLITPRNRLASELGWWAPEPEPVPEGEASDAETGAEEADDLPPARHRPPQRRPVKRKPARRRPVARKTARTKRRR